MSESISSVLLIGASGHASVIIDIVEKQGIWRIAGLFDPLAAAGGSLMGHPVYGSGYTLRAVMDDTGARGGIIAIGDNAARARVAGDISSDIPGFQFVTAVHPSAQVARDTVIGDGAVVMAGAVINSRSRLGAHCIVNTRASVDHDGLLDDFSSLGPNATLGGNVRVGRFAYVGLSASVIHGTEIGEHTVVGAGAVVLGDLPPRVVAYGVPARVVRARAEGDPYLKRSARTDR